MKDTIWVFLNRVRRLNYRHVLPDIVLMVGSLYLSLYLRLSIAEYPDHVGNLTRHIPLVIVIRLFVMTAMGAYDIIWRYLSLSDCLRIARAVVVSFFIVVAASYLVDLGRIPRAVFFIDAILVTTLLGGIRLLRRWVFDSTHGRRARRTGKLTLIYGAGANGRYLAQRLSADSLFGCNLVGFIDDNPEKFGRYLSGVKVLGNGRDLAPLIRDLQITEVIVGVANPSGEMLRNVVEACRPFGINPRMVTKFSGFENAGKTIHMFRKIELADLLNRPKRELNTDSIRDLVRNRKVLITGAGGSIGSELARQVFNHQPSALLLLDHSEFNLYQIDHELKEGSHQNTWIVPLLMDLKDAANLERVFSEHLPDVVIHAAAYKHVHLVEANPFPSIQNNILGTQLLVNLSEKTGVSTFVLISTDKAVNPAGVMGATKRVCELIVASAGRRTGKLYTAVRFGNVLGSSGSLIPLLTKQIQNGEPLTITHQDMARYFMLIPEAVSLVLKAATVAQPGDITILKMGDPVKIVDIARSLITLLGKTELEVPIVYTGMRPGEKIVEELYLCGNELKTTEDDILVLPRGDGSGTSDYDHRLQQQITKIIEAAAAGDRQSIVLMNHLIKGTVSTTAPVRPEGHLRGLAPVRPGDSRPNETVLQ